MQLLTGGVCGTSQGWGSKLRLVYLSSVLFTFATAGTLANWVVVLGVLDINEESVFVLRSAKGLLCVGARAGVLYEKLVARSGSMVPNICRSISAHEPPPSLGEAAPIFL
jgi:hypothetical protein